MARVFSNRIEELNIEQLGEIARNMKRVTNSDGGGYGFISEMEKRAKTDLHQGKV